MSYDERRSKRVQAGRMAQMHRGQSVEKAIPVPERREDLSIVTEGEARKIFGHMFVGSREVQATYGSVRERIPIIPYPRKVLERASRLGFRLVYQAQEMSKHKDKIENIIRLRTLRGVPEFKLLQKYERSKSKDTDDCAFLGQTVHEGWKLVHEDPRKCSLERASIVEQIEKQVAVLRELYAETPLPQKIQRALAEYDAIKDALKQQPAETIYEYGKRVYDILRNTTFFVHFYEKPIELVYRFLIYRKNNGVSSTHISLPLRTREFVATPDGHHSYANIVIKSVDFYREGRRKNKVVFAQEDVVGVQAAYTLLMYMFEADVYEMVAPEL